MDITFIEEHMKPLVWWKHGQSGEWFGGQGEPPPRHIWNLYKLSPKFNSPDHYNGYFAIHNHVEVCNDLPLEEAQKACEDHLKEYLKSYFNLEQ